jgi:hypothetical protein
VATKGPGEDGAGGVAFRPGVMGQVPSATEALERSLPRSENGYGRGITQVFGDVTRTQWLTTLTGESPTSSDSTPAAEPVMPSDKAKPKREVYAAERRGPTRTAALWGWQLFRSSGDGRERKTQRKDDPIGRTMRIVTTQQGAAPCRRRPDLFRTARSAVSNTLHGTHGRTIRRIKLRGDPETGRWSNHFGSSTIR